MAETMERGDVVVSIAAEMKGTVGAETKTTYATATAPPEGEARNVAALPQPDLPLAIQRTLRMKMWTILNVANCLSIGIGYYLRYTPSLYAMVGGIEAGVLVFILLILSGGLMQKSQTRPALAPAATLLFVVVSGVFLAVCSPLFKSHIAITVQATLFLMWPFAGMTTRDPHRSGSGHRVLMSFKAVMLCAFLAAMTGNIVFASVYTPSYTTAGHCFMALVLSLLIVWPMSTTADKMACKFQTDSAWELLVNLWIESALALLLHTCCCCICAASGG